MINYSLPSQDTDRERQGFSAIDITLPLVAANVAEINLTSRYPATGFALNKQSEMIVRVLGGSTIFHCENEEVFLVLVEAVCKGLPELGLHPGYGVEAEGVHAQILVPFVYIKEPFEDFGVGIVQVQQVGQGGAFMVEPALRILIVVVGAAQAGELSAPVMPFYQGGSVPAMAVVQHYILYYLEPFGVGRVY